MFPSLKQSSPSLLALLMCLGAACTTPEDPSEQVDGPALESAAGEVASLTFLLVNTTDETLYFEQGESAFVGFTATLDGEVVSMQRGCALCLCDVQSCAACGRDIPAVIALAPGEERRFEWDGQLWFEEPDTIRENASCVRPQQAPMRGAYSLEISSSSSFEAAEFGRVLSDPRRKSFDFSYSPAQPPIILSF